MAIILKYVGLMDSYDDSFSWAEALSFLINDFKNHVSVIDKLHSRYELMSFQERYLYDSISLFRLSDMMSFKDYLINASIEDVLTCPKVILNDCFNSFINDLSVPLSEVSNVDLTVLSDELSNYAAFSDFKLPVDLLFCFKPVSDNFTRAFSLITRLYSVSDLKLPVVNGDNSLLDFIIVNANKMKLSARKIISLLLVKAFYGNTDGFAYKLTSDGVEVLKDEPLLYI